MQSMYKAEGVNPYASILPLLIQLPVLWALFQALTRVSFLKVGTFLSLELSQPDPYYILPVLAALFTFLSTWLTNKAAVEKNIALTLMTYVMPFIILVTSFNFASGVVLYWTVSNAFQVFQILLLNNPYKIIKVREEAVRVAHEKNKELNVLREKQVRKESRKTMVLFTGATVEEAIEKGLQELNISRLRAHIKVVSREKKGFWALVKSQQKLK